VVIIVFLVRLEVLTAASIKVAVFWVVAPCSLVERRRQPFSTFSYFSMMRKVSLRSLCIFVMLLAPVLYKQACTLNILRHIRQRDPTGCPRATSGQRPRVIRPAKLYDNLLQVATSWFILFAPKDLKKKSWFWSRLLLYVQVPATHTIDYKPLP
jgi:hypothetical protein